MNVAPCVFGDCAACALREIEASDLSPHSCDGGIDCRDVSIYHPPCSECYERLYPATQDYQDAELNAFLEGTPFQEAHDENEKMDLTRENVWQDFKAWNESGTWDELRWPSVTMSVDREVVEESETGQVKWRVYKPFRVQKHQYEEFKEFLGMIF